jgi:cytochrome c-type biogenesis protein CcmH/NrfG
MPSGYLSLGKILTSQERYTDAVKVYQTGLQHIPNSVDLMYGLGRLLHARFSKAAEAREILTQAVELDPDHGPSRLELARISNAHGTCSQSEGWVAPLLANTSVSWRTTEAYALVGRCYLEERSPNAAIPYLEGAVERNPVSVSYLLWLGRAYWEAGEVVAARVTYERALALDPDQSTARRALAALDEAAP